MRFELTTSALPRRRSVLWSYRGDVPGAGLEPACADFKDRPGCQQPTLEWSRLPVPTRVSCLTGAGSQPCATAGTGASGDGRFRFTDQQGSPCLRRCWVSSAGVGPALSATSTLRLLPNWATRTWSRHPVPIRAIRRTKAEPQPCAAAQLPGQGSNLHCWGQGPVSCLIGRPGIGCGRRDSDPHRPCGPAGFEPAVYAFPPLPQSAPPGT